MAKALMESEVTGPIGADRYGRTSDRQTYFLRNVLATIPRSAREPVAAIIRTIFA